MLQSWLKLYGSLSWEISCLHHQSAFAKLDHGHNLFVTQKKIALRSPISQLLPLCSPSPCVWARVNQCACPHIHKIYSRFTERVRASAGSKVSTQTNITSSVFRIHGQNNNHGRQQSHLWPFMGKRTLRFSVITGKTSGLWTISGNHRDGLAAITERFENAWKWFGC